MLKTIARNPNKGNGGKTRVPLHKKVNTKLRNGTMQSVTFGLEDNRVIRQTITDSFVTTPNGKFRKGKDIVQDLRAIQHDLGAKTMLIS